MTAYVEWNASGVETVQPGEADEFKRIGEQFNRMQMLNFKEHHHCFRATHLKTRGCLVTRLTVKDGLPAHLRQGMFKEPKAYDAIMRYSMLAVKLPPDNAGAPRGLGLKVFGVKGDKIFQDPDRETQDFMFNNYPYIELRNTKATYEIADSLERNWNDINGLVNELKARHDADLALNAAGLPQGHLAATKHYSQSAYRYGNYVAKFALFPVTPEQKDLSQWTVKSSDPIDVLSTVTQEFHQQHSAKWSFCVQLLQNLDEQPVEDIGVGKFMRHGRSWAELTDEAVWDESKYPWEEVAILEAAPQDSFKPSFRAFWDDRLELNSWHGLEEHRPLGSTSRVRRVVYAESRKMRLKMNATTIIEPSSLADLPL